MVPTSLEQWTIPIIEDLLAQGYYEQERFDYKQMLPYAKDKEGTKRLLKTCCAFANSYGGFLVFGVDDDKSKSAVDRLVGIDPYKDFPVEFGEYPKKCNPTVPWEFKNPALTLPSGNKVHIIYIPRSWSAPHYFEDAEHAGWLFFSKRTNKGNEEMSYEEIRMSFLRYYEKRLKLQLLQSELENIKRHASILPGSIYDPETPQSPPFYGLGEFGLAVTEAVLADTYTILASDQGLLRLLTDIRNVCRNVNNLIRYGPNIAITGAEGKVGHHNGWVRLHCDQIKRDCDNAIERLAQVIAS